MLKRVPVVAKAGTAVTDTLGGAGVLFDRADIAEFAETAALLAKPGPAREAVLRGQDKRVQDFAMKTTLGRLREIVEGL
jgi:glycosyltransferase involved in cell wall biosynthesis